MAAVGVVAVGAASVAAVVEAAVGLVAGSRSWLLSWPWLWLRLHCSGLLLEPALWPDDLPVLGVIRSRKAGSQQMRGAPVIRRTSFRFYDLFGF